jgi:hypothetical protein
MKNLLALFTLIVSMTATQAALPVFFGGTTNYMTNTGSAIELWAGNRKVFSAKHSNADFSVQSNAIFLANITMSAFPGSRMLTLDAFSRVTNTEWSAVSPGFGFSSFTNAGLLWLENTNRINGVATATTIQVDFSTTDNTYEVTNLAGDLIIQLTNYVKGRDKWVYIRTDGTPRAITVSTNGMATTTRVSWGLTSLTNGGTAFTATNRARVNFACVPTAEIAAGYEHQQ